MVVPHLIAVLIAVDTDNKLKTLKKEILKHCPEVTIMATANSIEQGRKMIDIHQPNMVFMEIIQILVELLVNFQNLSKHLSS